MPSKKPVSTEEWWEVEFDSPNRFEKMQHRTEYAAISFAENFRKLDDPNYGTAIAIVHVKSSTFIDKSRTPIVGMTGDDVFHEVRRRLVEAGEKAPASGEEAIEWVVRQTLAIQGGE